MSAIQIRIGPTKSKSLYDLLSDFECHISGAEKWSNGFVVVLEFELFDSNKIFGLAKVISRLRNVSIICHGQQFSSMKLFLAYLESEEFNSNLPDTSHLLDKLFEHDPSVSITSTEQFRNAYTEYKADNVDRSQEVDWVIVRTVLRDRLRLKND